MKTLFLISFLSFFGKNPSDDGIPYRTLSWSDFRAPVPENIPTIAALTATQLVMDEKMEDGQYRFSVTAYFEPDSSYVRVKSDAVLRHEQTHFKIAFLMAKRCMLDMRPLQGGGEEAEKKADGIYNQYLQATSDLNAQFDKETNHSIDKAAEQEWESKISKQLKVLIDGRVR